MGWLKLDDHITHHVKFLKAGASASWLWVCCLAHCQRQLSDGFVSSEVLPLLGSASWKRDIERLVTVGLLDRTDGGFSVHDYLDHNSSRAEVLTRRAQDASRKGRGFRQDSERNPRGVQTESGASRARPLPSPPIPSQKERESAATRTGSGPLAGSLPRDHLRHAFCGRVCLPEQLFGDFCRLIGGDQQTAPDRVRAFCRGVDDAWSNGGQHSQEAIGDDVFGFWRARWAEQHGTTRKSAADIKREAEEAMWKAM